MKLLVSILTLSLGTHALAFDFALAAPIKRGARATPTITKTIYHTEVRRLSTSFKDHHVRSESLGFYSSASISDEVSEAINGDTATSMATAFLWPRGASGQKPTISQLPVTGLPVSFNARQVGFVHFDDDTKRDETLHPGPNIVNRRNTGLYHIKIDLASEGYISVFMSNSTASAFCKSEVELDSEGGPKGELQLAVRNSTKVVAIPVHQEAADSFCLHFKNAEGVDSPSSGKVPGSSTAIASVSEGKMSKVTPSETTSESVSKSSKHASTVVTASETDTDDSASATSATSTGKTTSLNTFDITHEIDTSKSTKHVPPEATVSEPGSVISETAESTSKATPKASDTEDTISDYETTKSSKHKSTSATASDSDLATSESAPDVSSKHKTKSTASGADENSSKTAEASGTPTVSKAANADPSAPEESAPHSTKAKSKIPEATETEEMPESATSVQEYRGPAVDPANPADLDTSTTPKATPAAVPVSTTTDEPFTEASINSFYSYIKSFVETAPDVASIAGSTDQASIKTTDSENGALRRGILIAPTPALIGVRANTDPHSTYNSMTYTSDYSWKGAVSTAIASTTASSNAAIGRLKPPSLLWRMWYPATTTKIIHSRSFSGPGEEPEQEDEGFFNIDVEDDGPTRVSTGTDGVEEETAVATKFAHKQEDKDGDDEGIDVKDGDEEEEDGLPVDGEIVPDEGAETDEGAAGDDETLTSTKSKASHIKTAADEEDDSAPATDTSMDVQEKVTSTKKKLTDGGNDTNPTATASEDVEEKATSTKTKPADEDDDAEPTAIASEDVEEKATSTKLKPAEDEDEATPTFTSSKDVKEKATSTKTKHANDDEEATATSKATDDAPPEDDDEEESQDDTSADDTTTSTSHKSKSTKSATSNSDDDAEEKPTATSTSKSKSTHKSKTPIPSLASGVSFAFPSSTSPNPNPNAGAIPTPPPIPTGTAASLPIPTQPIIWDPDCPQISTSTLTAPNGVTTTLPMTVGLGCWRTLPQAGSGGSGSGGEGGFGGNETMTGGANGHMIKSKAWNILSDRQNVKLGVVCWLVIGGIFFQWFVGQLQFVRGEWHLGRTFVWYILGIELLGIGRRLVERAEEAQRTWEKAERERERIERLARLGG